MTDEDRDEGRASATGKLKTYLVLIVGKYGGTEREPRVLPVAAENVEAAWENLRNGALIGDKLDDVVTRGLSDTHLAVYAAAEVLFPYFDDYVRERVAREAAATTAANTQAELNMLKSLAERHGMKLAPK